MDYSKLPVSLKYTVPMSRIMASIRSIWANWILALGFFWLSDDIY
jgi:hypothetical protein